MADDTIDTIVRLIETCRDGQAGYLEAAELARNGELRNFFAHQSLERSKFAGELESVARNLGDAAPGRGPSYAARLHHAWIDLKQMLGGGDASVLSSVELGESHAKSHYKEALQADLPAYVHDIIERQAESVSAAYDEVNALSSVYKKAA
jgi:uncharacterized protein (TIGR02284 family)